MHRKSIFDAVRRMLGRGFRPSEVRALDRAIDAAQHAGPASPDSPSTLSERGVALIQAFEGLGKLRPDGMIEAYPDPGTGDAPWTIGWGATGPDIVAGTVWTREQCDARLASDLARYAADVSRAIGDAPTTQAQFDALVSFHYNTGAIGRATLKRRHVAGDHAGAATEFARWNRAGGRVMRGLSRRRAAEAALYRGE
ncbi:glycoside hydrolase family protein [Altererythrobacter aerius]|uniref:Lysozyme n=1 Tax=Tsuneonella aeria TaxID=1837929 RepID=A0A6I4TFJ3_9SPHN|nr:lysozyme [Tsuneonella aeria]MXO76062.1 glycoside hydrolase family protein [Tsuneonella aeria]